MLRIPFDNSYAKLPDSFFARVKPTPVKQPQLIRVNRPLAELLGLDPDELGSPAGVQLLAGNLLPEGAEPIALAYAGHQFGNFVPQLGDGRAILLGELLGKDGLRRDVQLKGSGPTPFSRRGDGRAALGPVLREYIVSEAMFALGIPTTRALAAVATGEVVVREELQRGAVFARVAASHLRVGTFEFFAARRDRESLRRLVDYALLRHFPQCFGAESPALALLDCVIDAQANLIARWLGVGFIHGVMNTDNTSISGETIDYGPCAFLDEYRPDKKFSSIDHGKRYAFGNQPRIAQWNVTAFAETLVLLLGEEAEAVKQLTERLERFPLRFEAAYLKVLRGKLGLAQSEAGDRELALDLLERMAASEVDYTILFRRLCDAAESANADSAVAELFDNAGAYHEWAERWRGRLSLESAGPSERAAAMRLVNPAFIPRNHRIAEAIEAAVSGDLSVFERLTSVLERPFEEQPEAADLALPPRKEERVRATFCGT